jgi:hypothetical protein
VSVVVGLLVRGSTHIFMSPFILYRTRNSKLATRNSQLATRNQKNILQKRTSLVPPLFLKSHTFTEPSFDAEASRVAVAFGARCSGSHAIQLMRWRCLFHWNKQNAKQGQATKASLSLACDEGSVWHATKAPFGMR